MLLPNPPTVPETFTAPAPISDNTVPTSARRGTFLSNVSNRFTRFWNWFSTPFKPDAPYVMPLRILPMSVPWNLAKMSIVRGRVKYARWARAKAVSRSTSISRVSFFSWNLFSSSSACFLSIWSFAGISASGLDFSFSAYRRISASTFEYSAFNATGTSSLLCSSSRMARRISSAPSS